MLEWKPFFYINMTLIIKTILKTTYPFKIYIQIIIITSLTLQKFPVIANLFQ